MNPSAPYPGRTLVQSNVIPVQNNTPNNLPSGWFYNGQILRSDSRAAFQNILTGTDTGSQTNLLEFGPGNFQWTTDRLIVAAFLDMTIEVDSTALYGEAGVYLVHYDSSAFVFPTANTLGTPTEGGATGALIGASVSTNHPGTAATYGVASKTAGINFYPAPFYVAAQSQVKIMHYLLAGNGGNNNLYARATIFSVPAN